VAATVALGAVVLLRGEFASGSSMATVRIGSAGVPVGGTDTVALEALSVDAPALGAVTVDVTYDPAVKTVVDCEPDPQHLFDVALCNESYSANTIRFTGLSAAGVSGNSRLADITFQASGTEGDCTTLAVSIATFASPDGAPITPVSTQDGTNCVGTPTPSLTPRATATPTPGPDADSDGLPDSLDPCPNDDDCDDDGLMDGAASSEDLNNNGVVDPGETHPENWDSDGDGLSDGLERGLAAPEGEGTDTSSLHWRADTDPSTRTDPLSVDTDGDTVPDSQEDVNANGAVDPGESDPSLVAVPLSQGWSQTCYVGSSTTVDQALDSIGGRVSAVYRFGAAQTLDRWFPGRPDVSSIPALAPYDQLLVLTSEATTWNQQFSGESQGSVALAQGWNGVCYSGATADMETATAGISGQPTVIYALEADQSWERYIPGRPDLSDMTQSERLRALLILVPQEDGATWVFNP